MARRTHKKGGQAVSQGWLVTFSDLVTLLLTFFVLLLSMSTLDKKIITIAFTNFSDKAAFLDSRASGRIPQEIELIEEILENPWEILDKKNRIKDLLFPDRVLHPDINRSTLDQNIQVLNRPEGVALVLSDKLLFAPESSRLSSQATRLLEQIRLLIMAVNAPVNVAGYTDATGGPHYDNTRLSAERALTVLNHFLTHGLSPEQFSVSGYGPHRPLASNQTPSGRKQNRRVEIVLKTKPHAKTYL